VILLASRSLTALPRRRSARIGQPPHPASLSLTIAHLVVSPATLSSLPPYEMTLILFLSNFHQHLLTSDHSRPCAPSTPVFNPIFFPLFHPPNQRYSRLCPATPSAPSSSSLFSLSSALSGPPKRFLIDTTNPRQGKRRISRGTRSEPLSFSPLSFSLLFTDRSRRLIYAARWYL
jgi:hypothetical protein